ncbi:class III lanthionine synthetase LanKC [Micromonospora chalcea]|uniref:class III lanthionine synthetase LanKC n=1 Tax=Micromonospora sp. TSRI0369 TaxID=1703936 RepID=UPI00093B81ED|nr:class III lanthionine synthetase LanKC [Micromonospora sp. TSRI0369]
MPTPGAFLIADPVHVDSPAHVADTASRFPLADQTPPDGWRVAEHGGWIMWHPPHAQLPQQGWKVHVSVNLDDAADALDLVREHCVRHRIAFKFQRSRRLALVNNEKYAHRAGSGKLAALYPADDTALRRILDDLGAQLAGYRGPYVLSDLRWHDGPLYLRYGGFAELWCVDGDQPVPAVTRPDGTLVPDRREPVFTVPDWAPVPDFVAEHIAAVDAQTDDEPPYRIEEALHHSNAGGVYRATDLRDGRTVVLREARPHAGLDGAGTDALTRLRREETMLRRLAGLDCVPQLLDRLTWWEHQFLVEEHIEGDTLQHHLAMRHPLIHPDPTHQDLTDYTAWALDVIDQVEAALAQVHARGVVFGDLHTANVMIRPDGRVVLVDFEQAYLADEDFTPSLGDPGFATPRIRRGPAVDTYALACLRLAVFVPLTPLAALCDEKFDDLLTVARRFPLPPGYLDRIRDDLHTALNPPAPGRRRVTRFTWPADQRRLIDSLAAGIRATATPHRTDRLFPGDPGQFPHGGATLAHGAAGVIWALVNTGVDYPERDEHLDWLTRAARRLPAAHLGLYDGLAGIAALLDRTGRHDDAGELLDRCRTGLHHRYGPGLHSGLAGIGLALLRPGRPAPDDALHIGDRLARTLTGDTKQPVPEPARPGLLHGWSGPAIFLTRLHEATGDPAWLRAARTALRRDLQHTVRDDNGNLHVRDGARRLFYLDEGSAGIAVAAHTLLRHGERQWLRDVVTTVRRTIDVEFVLLPGLFHGRAGLLATAALLTDDPPRGTTPHGPLGLVRDDAPHHVPAHLARLAWHAYALDGRLAFPGDTLLRISTDLAAGGAGILSAIHAALHRTAVTLPFLDAPTHVAPTGHLLAAS